MPRTPCHRPVESASTSLLPMQSPRPTSCAPRCAKVERPTPTSPRCSAAESCPPESARVPRTVAQRRTDHWLLLRVLGTSRAAAFARSAAAAMKGRGSRLRPAAGFARSAPHRHPHGSPPGEVVVDLSRDACTVTREGVEEIVFAGRFLAMFLSARIRTQVRCQLWAIHSWRHCCAGEQQVASFPLALVARSGRGLLAYFQLVITQASRLARCSFRTRRSSPI